MLHLILVSVVMGLPTNSCMAGQNVVLIAPVSSQEAGRASADNTLKFEIDEKGKSVIEIPADEAGIEQAAALGNGGPVIVVDPGAKGGYKVYDGATGADITKKFNSGLVSKEELDCALFGRQSEPIFV